MFKLTLLLLPIAVSVVLTSGLDNFNGNFPGNIFNGFSNGNGNSNRFSGGMSSNGGGLSTICNNNICTVCNNFACKVIEGSGPMSISCQNNNPCTFCSANKCETVFFPPQNTNLTNGGTMRQHYLAGCSNAFCPADCEGYVLEGSDSENQCPVCKCGDFGLKEPCSTNNDCESNDCFPERGLCRYPLPQGPVLVECAFDSNCPSTEECAYGGFCVPSSGEKPPHLEGVQCVFPNQCPASMFCRQMTCYEQTEGGTADSGGRKHEQGIQCVFSNQCSPGYTCVKNQMTCQQGGPDADHEPQQCVFNSQCSVGYRCRDMTCIRS